LPPQPLKADYLAPAEWSFPGPLHSDTYLSVEYGRLTTQTVIYPHRLPPAKAQASLPWPLIHSTQLPDRADHHHAAFALHATRFPIPHLPIPPTQRIATLSALSDRLGLHTGSFSASLTGWQSPLHPWTCHSQLSLHDLSGTIEAGGIPFTNASLHLAFHGTDLTINRATATLGENDIRLHGLARQWSDPSNREWQIHFESHHLPFHLPFPLANAVGTLVGYDAALHMEATAILQPEYHLLLNLPRPESSPFPPHPDSSTPLLSLPITSYQIELPSLPLPDDPSSAPWKIEGSPNSFRIYQEISRHPGPVIPATTPEPPDAG